MTVSEGVCCARRKSNGITRTDSVRIWVVQCALRENAHLSHEALAPVVGSHGGTWS